MKKNLPSLFSFLSWPIAAAAAVTSWPSELISKSEFPDKAANEEQAEYDTDRRARFWMVPELCSATPFMLDWVGNSATEKGI